jgi:hypothetical protein
MLTNQMGQDAQETGLMRKILGGNAGYVVDQSTVKRRIERRGTRGCIKLSRRGNWTRLLGRIAWP